MIHLTMVGCGAIGAGVLELLQRQPGVRVTAIVLPPGDHPRACANAARLAPQARLVSHVRDVEHVDLLVECAGHSAIEEQVLPALELGIPCLVASVGAVSAPGMAQRLEAAAAAGKTQVQLLAGAIGGIDALASARIGGLESVTYIGRKPPQAWKGTAAEAHCDLDALTQPLCIFQGSAQQAAQLYPRNANVAATLSLAGLGLQRTQVQLYADPCVSDNVHQVEARGAFGSMEITMRGKPLATNPKTSALTVYSMVRAISNHASALAI